MDAQVLPFSACCFTMMRSCGAIQACVLQACSDDLTCRSRGSNNKTYLPNQFLCRWINSGEQAKTGRLQVLC